MARPRTSLLERCCEKTFRPRQHWRLLAVEPELPVPELAELQRRARGSDEEAQRELARVFGQRLRALTEADRQRLAEASQPVCGDDGGDRAAELEFDQESELMVELEAALVELVARIRVDLTPGERFRASLLRGGVRQLAAIEAQLACEGLTVAGSRGQRRPHPLLAQAAVLRRDLDGRYRRFELDVKLRAQLDRAQARFFERRRQAAERVQAGTAEPAEAVIEFLRTLGARATAESFGDLGRQPADPAAEDADDPSGQERPR